MSKFKTILLFAIVIGGSAVADDRVERTGSRLGGTGSELAVLRLSEPWEINHVLDLIERDKADEAVKFAEDYLDSLGSTIELGGTSIASQRYFALNAVCVARTAAGSIDTAVAACTEAIGMLPSRWTAINNRGTAYFAARQYQQALDDYRRALAVAPSNQANVVATIEHNIELAEQRLAGD